MNDLLQPLYSKLKMGKTGIINVNCKSVLPRQIRQFSMGYFTVVYLVAKPLIWSEAGGNLVVIETSIYLAQ